MEDVSVAFHAFNSTGESLETVQKEVADIIKGRILVGHAIRNDLKVLFLSHPHRLIRDTQRLVYNIQFEGSRILILIAGVLQLFCLHGQIFHCFTIKAFLFCVCFTSN